MLLNIENVLERLLYNRLYIFLEMNSVIYDLRLGFRQKYSTSHALIHLTDKIIEQLDSGNFACGIFADIQNAFDTVGHDILIPKLNHFGIRGVANNWLSLYLQNLYNTRWSNLGCIVVPPHTTKLYGRNSVNISAIYSWNYLQKIKKIIFSIHCHQISLR